MKSLLQQFTSGLGIQVWLSASGIPHSNSLNKLEVHLSFMSNPEPWWLLCSMELSVARAPPLLMF